MTQQHKGEENRAKRLQKWLRKKGFPNLAKVLQTTYKNQLK